MTTATRPSAANSRRDWVAALAGLVLVAVGALVFYRMSLDGVSGVTRWDDGTCCRTQFVNDYWFWSMAGLAIPVWMVTRSSPWTGALAVAALTVVSFEIARTTVNRYDDSGWGDGMEVFAFVTTAFHLLVFGTAFRVGLRSWRRRRLGPAGEVGHVGTPTSASGG